MNPSKVDLTDALLLPCGAKLPNRIAKAAMTEGIADEYSMPTEHHANLYRMWGSGNAGGLLITGNFQVDRRYMERPGNICIEKSMNEKELIEKINKYIVLPSTEKNKDIKVWAQLGHAGRQCTPLVNSTPVGPSAVRGHLGSMPLPVPKALSVADIQNVVDRFAYAAYVCKQAGLHGVQVHAAHGYLISSFLNPKANIRTDEYGGSIENRARVLIETVRAVRKAVGPDYPVGVKLNCSDFIKGGLDHQDSLKVALMLENENIDLLEVSGGNYENPAMMAGGELFNDMQKLSALGKSSTEIREAYFLVFSKDIVKALTRTPVLVTGGFRSRKVMEDALRTGEAHMIGVGRPLCGSPDCVKQLLDGKISKLPSPENELTLPWYINWTTYIIIGNLIKFGAIQMWTYDMLIRMGNNKLPSTTVDIFVLLGSVNTHDSKKAAALKGLPASISGASYNPSWTTKHGGNIALGVIILIAAILIRRRIAL